MGSKLFSLYRQTDVTGVSGTGIVAEGVQFSGGLCVMQWCVSGQPNSVSHWDSVEDLIAIHGHDGATTVVWEDR